MKKKSSGWFENGWFSLMLSGVGTLGVLDGCGLVNGNGITNWYKMGFFLLLFIYGTVGYFTETDAKKNDGIYDWVNYENELFQSLREVMNKHNPIGVDVDTLPRDEYDDEVIKMLMKVPNGMIDEQMETIKGVLLNQLSIAPVELLDDLTFIFQNHWRNNK